MKRLALAEVCPPSCAIFDVCGPFYILVQRKQHVHRHPKTFEQQRTRPSSRAPYHQKRSLFATVMSTSQGVGYGAPRGGGLRERSQPSNAMLPPQAQSPAHLSGDGVRFNYDYKRQSGGPVLLSCRHPAKIPSRDSSAAIRGRRKEAR